MTDTPKLPEWFDDEEQLLGELRDAASAEPVPVVAGLEELRRIGAGGQGEVWEARETATRRRVAVKVLRADAFADEASRQRFDRESELVARLDHPAIVGAIRRAEADDGRPAFVMEFVDGESLDEHAERERAGTDPKVWHRRAIELIAEIADALAHAHRRGIVHRDLKPSNIRIDATGRPRVLDFGLARMITPDALGIQVTVSRSGSFLGSLAWASPEQAAGRLDDIDTRTDVYALGLLLWYLLVGTHPLDLDRPLVDVLHDIMHESLPALPSVIPDADPQLALVVSAAVAKSPDDRYETAADLARDLRRLLAGEPVSIRRESAWRAMRRSVARSRTMLIVVCALFAAAVMVGFSLNAQARSAHDAAIAARAAEAAARREIERLESVNRFLTRMIAMVDPNDLGDDVSLRAILDLGATELAMRADGGAAADMAMVLVVAYRTLGADAASLAQADAAIAKLREMDEVPADRLAIARIERFFTLAEMDRMRDAAAELERIDDVAAELELEHPARLRVEEARAQLAAAEGDDETAERTLTDLLPRVQAAYGDDHPISLRIMGSLGVIAARDGRLDEAVAIHTRGLEGRRRTFGPAHPCVLVQCRVIAHLELQRERPAAAERWFREVIRIGAGTWAASHTYMLLTHGDLAHALGAQGRVDEATEIQRDLLDDRSEHLGPSHPHTIASAIWLAHHAHAAGDYEHAIAHADDAIARAVDSTDLPPSELVRARRYRGISLHGAGRYDEAIDEHTRIVEILDELPRGGPRMRVYALHDRAVSLDEADRLDEAEHDLLAAWDVVKDVPNAAELQTETVDRLINFYTRLGRDDDAQLWRSRR